MYVIKSKIKMKMLEIVVIIGIFVGGFFTGQQVASRKCDKRMFHVEQQASKERAVILAKVDSLQKLPAKVDTVIQVVTKIEHKTDTLILLNYRIFENTDTIKNELRNLRHEVKSER